MVWVTHLAAVVQWLPLVLRGLLPAARGAGVEQISGFLQAFRSKSNTLR
jgi:hypothetical protein